MTAARVDQTPRPRLPAPHFGGATRFEQEASRAWGLSIVEALTGPAAWGVETTGGGGRIVWARLEW